MKKLMGIMMEKSKGKQKKSWWRREKQMERTLKLTLRSVQLYHLLNFQPLLAFHLGGGLFSLRLYPRSRTLCGDPGRWTTWQMTGEETRVR
jgi:hypothetical protein